MAYHVYKRLPTIFPTVVTPHLMVRSFPEHLRCEVRPLSATASQQGKDTIMYQNNCSNIIPLLSIFVV